MNLARVMKIANIYKADVLSPMQDLQRIWIDMRTSVIANCWRHAGLLGGTSGSEVVKTDRLECADRRGLQTFINQVVAKTKRVILENLLNPADKNSLIEEVSNDALVAHIL